MRRGECIVRWICPAVEVMVSAGSHREGWVGTEGSNLVEVVARAESCCDVGAGDAVADNRVPVGRTPVAEWDVGCTAVGTGRGVGLTMRMVMAGSRAVMSGSARRVVVVVAVRWDFEPDWPKEVVEEGR